MIPEEQQYATLLQEYGYCNEQIGRLDGLIWQTASVVYPISLAGFAYFGATTTNKINQFLALLAVAIGSIALLILWYLLCRLWFRFQTIAFHRMLEIESELGMWRFRYSSFMGRSSESRISAISKMSEDEQLRFDNLQRRVGHFRGVGLKSAIACLTFRGSPHLQCTHKVGIGSGRRRKYPQMVITVGYSVRGMFKESSI